MATLSTLERSRQDSRPIEVYEIVIGSETFRWAAGEDDLTIGGDLYTHIGISRNNVIIGADQQRRTLLVKVRSTNDFTAKYYDVVPGDAATLTVTRYQRDESPAFNTSIRLFEGLVQSVQFPKDGEEAVIAVRSIEAALSRNIPRFTYMAQCNHFLYDSGCGVDPTLHDHTGAVTLVDDNEITISGVSASGLSFVNGFCGPPLENDFRKVLAQSGDVLTLPLPFHNDQTGISVLVRAGCDHLVRGDCALVFDNVDRFGGFPFVPIKNVFETGLD